MKSLPIATASNHLLYSWAFGIFSFFTHPDSVYFAILLSVVRNISFCFFPLLPGTAFLLWYLFCPHMSGMYHGTTCGSQLYLPPRCPTGLQDSHHSAPGRCSAGTTGYSSKMLPTWVLYFPLLLLPPSTPPACLLQGKVSRQKALCFCCQSSHPFCFLRSLTEVAVELKIKCCYVSFAFLQHNPVM